MTAPKLVKFQHLSFRVSNLLLLFSIGDCMVQINLKSKAFNARKEVIAV